MQTPCDKETFKTFAEAKTLAAGMSASGKHKTGFYAYKCSDCQLFHIATKKGKLKGMFQKIHVNHVTNFPSAVEGAISPKQNKKPKGGTRVIRPLTERLVIPEDVLNKLKQIK